MSTIKVMPRNKLEQLVAIQGKRLTLLRKDHIQALKEARAMIKQLRDGSAYLNSCRFGDESFELGDEIRHSDLMTTTHLWLKAHPDSGEKCLAEAFRSANGEKK